MTVGATDVSGGMRRVSNGSGRILYFDILRAIAPVFVVFVHALVTFRGHTLKIHLLQEIGRWAVPVFFMISGALLLDSKKSFNIKKFYLKNVKRLLIALIFWLLVYAVLFTIFEDKTSGIGYYFGSNLSGGNAYHLWFLFAMIAIYLLVPILRCICRKRKLLEYSIALGIVTCFVLPFVDVVIRIIAYVSGWEFLKGYADGGHFFERLSQELRSFCFVTYFLLGYMLSKRNINEKMRRIIYGVGIIGWLLNFAWIFVGERILGLATAANYFFFPVLCLSAALFLFARYAFRDIKKLPRIVTFMSRYSFGIYLSHLGILIFFLAKISFFSENAATIMLGVVIAYTLSLGLSWLMSKVPIIKRFV